MKKLFFMGVMGMFLLGSCNNHSGHSHEGHDHEGCTHSHEEQAHNHEGHSHEHDHEGHNHEAGEHNHEGHNHEATDAHDQEGHNHEGHNHAQEAKAEAHAGHDHGHEHGSNPDEIILAPEKAKAAGVASMEIQPKAFRQVIKASGEVQSAQGNESTIVANVSGVVSFQRSVTEGMQVGKGTALMSISASNLQDGDPAERARIAYESAKADFDRASRLVESQIVSQKEFNAIKEKYESAKLAYEALSKNQTKNGVSVTSPMGGYIKNLLVKEGDYVAVGQPLATVTQNNRLFLRADVSERYYKYLNGITSANFKTPYDNQVYELEALNGKLLSYGKSAGSFYIPVTFSFDNKGDIMPGSFVEIYLLSKPMENTIALPIEALTEEQGLYFIYIQKCAESYRKQEVKLGASNGKEVEILSGVNPGDKVVVKGAYHVKLASASNALPAHSHEH
ncbi:MAG: efflux RND transporter periplasmic adaptor subunit [Bacteroidaceae bacterium]|nr:efflux RND transporter periplasmic adaptor subunit [Bacteroidaceae bacterium]